MLRANRRIARQVLQVQRQAYSDVKSKPVSKPALVGAESLKPAGGGGSGLALPAGIALLGAGGFAGYQVYIRSQEKPLVKEATPVAAKKEPKEEVVEKNNSNEAPTAENESKTSSPIKVEPSELSVPAEVSEPQAAQVTKKQEEEANALDSDTKKEEKIDSEDPILGSFSKEDTSDGKEETEKVSEKATVGASVENEFEISRAGTKPFDKSEALQASRTKSDILSSLDKELMSLDEMSKNKRFDTIDHILRDINLQDAKLRKSVNQMVFDNSKNMSKDASDDELRMYIRQLVAEMEMRSKWETVRLQNLLELIEERAATANKATLRAQKLKADIHLAKELDLKKLEIENLKSLALADLDRKALERRSKELLAHYQQIKQEKELELESYVEQRRAIMEEELQQALNAQNLQAQADDSTYVSNFELLSNTLQTFQDMKNHLDVWGKDSTQMQQLSHEVARLGNLFKPSGPTPASIEKMKNSLPLVEGATDEESQKMHAQQVASFANNTPENLSGLVNKLRHFDKADPLVKLCATMVNEAERSLSGDKKTLPSRAELWSSFEKDVKPACLAALYTPTVEEISSAAEAVTQVATSNELANPQAAREVASVVLPQNNKPGAGSYLLGAVRAWFATNMEMIPTTYDFIKDSLTALLKDENNKSKVSDTKQAQVVTERNLKDLLWFLERGDLYHAVEVANKVVGVAEGPLKDWKRDATARLVSEQAMEVLHTHTSVLNARYMA